MNLDKITEASEKILERLTGIREFIDATRGNYMLEAEFLQKRAADYPGKPIISGGKLHLAYIKDHTNPYYHGKEERAANTAENGCYYGGNGNYGGNRIHFYFCEKLREMEEDGKQKRYRIAMEINSVQPIDLPEEKNKLIHLAWCQLCIQRFLHDRQTLKKPSETEFALVARESPEHNNWSGNWEKSAKYGDAETLKQFFRPSNPLWKEFIAGLDLSAMPTDYPLNWENISAAFRRAKNYTCEICGVDCRKHTGLTDAHHINGEKSDCRYKNLQCLCIYHHSQRPKHEHYKPTESEMQILRQLWEEQNILAHLRG